MKKSYQRYQDYNLIRQTRIRLISDPPIKIVIKPNKYKVEDIDNHESLTLQEYLYISP